MTLISGRRLLDLLFESPPMGRRGPIVVAIDGRGGSGKSTLAGSLVATSTWLLPTILLDTILFSIGRMQRVLTF